MNNCLEVVSARHTSSKMEERKRKFSCHYLVPYHQFIAELKQCSLATWISFTGASQT